MKPRTLLLSACAAALAVVAGCASTGQAVLPDLSTRTLVQVRDGGPTRPVSGEQPTVALVLGGGGLRGFAHVGALLALEEAGIRPHIVVGTSAGSVVGAAYASGLNAAQIRQAAMEVKVSSLLDFTWRSGGIIQGNHLASWVGDVTGSVPIEQFPTRFAAVATDLQSGQAVLIEKGSAGRAIQASSAVPGVNVPVPYAAGHLIDGGITSLVPVRFARAMGADVVIAIDIYCRSPRVAGMSIPSVIGQVMQTQSCLVAAPEMAEADLLIAPVTDVPGMSAKAEKERVIEAGYQATREALRRWRASGAADA
ncbi:patatin-like phospholipase family protein [Hydrogenophaga sp.]|uniref:patatin-like phospholipase family protein n=1 Tax=Hydrogenophaga sp. TaxID=1904254 RepID=UPI003F6F7392